MTPKQKALYFTEWNKARLAGGLDGESRHRLHVEALGHDKSSKDFTNADLDKVLATFRAISQPTSLHAQLRQIDQPRTRLLHRIRDQFACLALFVKDPCKYVAPILQNRFHVTSIRGANVNKGGNTFEAGLGTQTIEDLLEDLRADDYTRPRARASAAGPAGQPISDSELVQIRNTLQRCLSSLRRKGRLVGTAVPSGPPQPISEHEMCRRARVDCFRPHCAECRQSEMVGRGSRRAELSIDGFTIPGAVIIHSSDNEPF